MRVLEDMLWNPDKKGKIVNYLSQFSPSQRQQKLVELNNALQKRTLWNENDYAVWKSISDKKMSLNGESFKLPKELPWREMGQNYSIEEWQPKSKRITIASWSLFRK